MKCMESSSLQYFHVKYPNIWHLAQSQTSWKNWMHMMSLATWTYWSPDIHEGADTGPIQWEPSQIDTPRQWFPKCGPGKGSIRITWELIKNANSWAPPHTDSETLGPSNLCFNKPSRGFWCLLNSEIPLGTAWENKNKTKPLKLLGTFEKEVVKVLQDPAFFQSKELGLMLKTTRLGSNQRTPN